MGRKRKAGRQPQESFAEVVERTLAESTGSPGPPVTFRSLIGEGEYVDERGVCWLMRSGDLRWSRVGRLMEDPAVRVLHVYLGEVRDVPVEERERLLARIRPYVRGEHRERGDYARFEVGEFKDDRRRSLIVVEESC